MNQNNIIFYTILLFLLYSCNIEKEKSKSCKKPNFVVVIADDLGWKDVGYHGSEIHTPVIDKLANEGIEFDRFYVHSVCSPTRASLITGRMPSRYGIYSPLGDEQGIPEGTMTIAELLRQNGYETAISGKWHLGTVPEARPMNYGFESSYGYLRGQIDPYTHLYKTGDRTWHRNDELIDEEGHATDLITNEAIRFIEKDREKDKPFFLYVTYSVPHYPLDEPDEWVDEYKDAIENKSRRNFAAAVTHMDNGIGKIMAAIEKKKIDKNTIILVTSDNGGQEKWMSETQYNGKFENHDVLGNNRPLRDWKSTLYDGALRVPAVLFYPQIDKPQKIYEHINVADLLPTFAHLAGVTIKSEWKIDGINFWPAIEGGKIPEDRIMYWRRAKWMAVKKGDWKLIHVGLNLDEGIDELYNISKDPIEQNNLASQFPGKIKELKNILGQQMALK